MPGGMFFPPGYTSHGSMRQIVAAKSSIMSAGRTVENLAQVGLAVIGSPETVRNRLIQCHNELGFHAFVALLHFGTMSAEKTENNIRLFAKEVLPAIQALDDGHYAGFEMPSTGQPSYAAE